MLSLFGRLEAKPGKEKEVAAFHRKSRDSGSQAFAGGSNCSLSGDSAEGDRRFRREGSQCSGGIPVRSRSEAMLAFCLPAK
jgi:hypothetical protein